MRSRGRSIRLRIYFLVAIPLVAMAGLLAYVVGTSVYNAISLDRVPNLINASGIPAAKFGVFVESERAAAVVYLFEPTAANRAAYQAAIAATNKVEPAFNAAMSSPAVAGTESAAGAKQIQAIFSGLKQLPTLRSAIQARVISPLAALAAYSQGMAATTKLFLIQTNSVVATDQLGPAIGLIATVQAREALSQEYALLAGMLAGHRAAPADRVAFTKLAAARLANLQHAENLLGPADLAAYNAPKAGSGAMQQDLATIEQAIAAGTPVSKLPVTAAQWQATAGALLTDYFNGGVAVSQAVLVADHQISHAAWVRVAAVSVVGLLGLLITILVTTLVAREIIRRLSGLERNALQLAEVQLPDVVGRLRRGEDVDVPAEAPPLEACEDEIGQVSQAFNQVQRTAIEAAVDQARLRRGVSAVFRNLARRSQSLLHRQLSLLDAMERRADDPDELSDLYRLDHLTTRMRRHAEGLIILSGAAPGRAWRNPVRLVDVLRAAVAEIEDYTRVTVVTITQAALAGPAVADVIHMIAELAENATLFSPPNTPVRLMGDIVGQGFVVEIEDRGLGLAEDKLAGINSRLANPPEFDLSDSDQLGLFVAARLAQRQGVKISLRPNPYGGVTAIVLIPHELVVPEEVFARDPSAVQANEGAVLPTGRHAAWADAIVAAAGQTAVAAGTPPYAAPAKMLDPGSAAGPADAGPGYGGFGHSGPEHSGHTCAGSADPGESCAAPGYAGLDVRGPSSTGGLPRNGAAAAVPAGTADEAAPPGAGSAGDETPAGNGSTGAAALTSPTAASGPELGRRSDAATDGTAKSRPPVSAPPMSWFQRTGTQPRPGQDGHEGAGQPGLGKVD
jgi:Nitrate and nitrite sensing